MHLLCSMVSTACKAGTRSSQWLLLRPAGADEEAPGTPSAAHLQPLARRKKAKRGKLGLLPLVALIFYEVSGGPFGTEVRLQTVWRLTPKLIALCWALPVCAGRSWAAGGEGRRRWSWPCWPC